MAEGKVTRMQRLFVLCRLLQEWRLPLVTIDPAEFLSAEHVPTEPSLATEPPNTKATPVSSFFSQVLGADLAFALAVGVGLFGLIATAPVNRWLPGAMLELGYAPRALIAAGIVAVFWPVYAQKKLQQSISLIAESASELRTFLDLNESVVRKGVVSMVAGAILATAGIFWSLVLQRRHITIASVAQRTLRSQDWDDVLAVTPAQSGTVDVCVNAFRLTPVPDWDCYDWQRGMGPPVLKKMIIHLGSAETDPSSFGQGWTCASPPVVDTPGGMVNAKCRGDIEWKGSVDLTARMPIYLRLTTVRNPSEDIGNMPAAIDLHIETMCPSRTDGSALLRAQRVDFSQSSSSP